MNKIKENRLISFITILIIYIIAGVIGVITYNQLKYDWWINLLIADVVSTIVTFIFSLIFKNASVYDPYWSVQPIVIIYLIAIGKQMTIGKILVLLAISYWGIRLTLNWGYTFKGLNHQDWRYTMLHEQTRKFYPIINFVGIHMVPTLIVYACTIPAAYMIIFSNEINIITIIGFIISIGAATLQLISDIQMQKYRKNRNGNFIRTGLWKYSRHPNYLGEILMWWGIAIMSFSVFNDKIYLLVGALLNTLLFLFVSIPMADKRQSKKEGFETYKKETRMLFPIKK